MTGTPRVASSARTRGEHLPAVEAGKADVEHDRSGRQRADQLEPLDAVPGQRDPHAEPVEVGGDQVERRPVVFDHDDDRESGIRLGFVLRVRRRDRRSAR